MTDRQAMLNIREHSNGVTIECRVTTLAGRSAIRGEREGALVVGLNAPPIEGRANEALIAFMAELLHIPRSRISLLSGEHSRNKVLFIQGVTARQLSSAL
ncbi:MAG: DUF167 domain-containing protein [bacterium]